MKQIQFYTIKSSGGLKAEISNLGAKITKLLVANRKGEVKDIVLGFRTADEWRTKETYFNAICGRVANRIKDGKFSLDGKQYQLPINNGTNSLHGGVEGFNAKIWEVVEQSLYEIKLHYRAQDGEEGYPGNLDEDRRSDERSDDQPRLFQPRGRRQRNRARAYSASERREFHAV